MWTKLFWGLFVACCFYDSYKPGFVRPAAPQTTEFEGEPIPNVAPKGPGVSLVGSEDIPTSSGEKSGYMSVDMCTSCGFRNKFEELRQELAAEMPMVTVVGGEYPIATPLRLLGEFLSSFRMIFLVFLFFGDWIKAKVGLELPYYQVIKANKLQAGLGVFAVCSLLSNFLLSSGAFEVTYNGALIFSKLKTGRMPHPREIISILRSLS